jgi:beta-1,2-mannobiose phosphorylase / 1,2-beta-oligomannan phosphorylase
MKKAKMGGRGIKQNINNIPAMQVKNIPLLLERFKRNPILRPNPENWWETKAVFNPAALYDGGKLHILYRAIGETDVSVLGYASSSDGLHIQERLDKPAYVPREPFEGVNPPYPQPHPGTPGTYVSGGGGMGGCEDPRITRIDDRVYMTYVAYDGRNPPRVALSSIHIDDFLNRRWNWKKPVLISQPHIVDKNACILPEKIGGKYVIFHRVYPNILIDFVDDLDFDGRTRWLTGQYEIPVRALSSDWDNHKVGAGPPPLKTKYGWLLIYQAVGRSDGYRYKIGAMLLDLKDPTRVIARSRKPILEPNAWYENAGLKAGVVYPCGAAIIDSHLFVYYGGADMVVCAASVKLNGFVEELSANHQESAAPATKAAPPSETGETMQPVQGFCVKCRRKSVIKNPCQVVLKNMRKAIRGVCPRCGKNMTKFVKTTPRAGKSGKAK